MWMASRRACAALNSIDPAIAALARSTVWGNWTLAEFSPAKMPETTCSNFSSTVLTASQRSRSPGKVGNARYSAMSS